MENVGFFPLNKKCFASFILKYKDFKFSFRDIPQQYNTRVDLL